MYPQSPIWRFILISSLVQNDILNYMVPTPFVLANRNSQIQTRPEIAASQKKTAPKVACELHQEALRVPSEVNVVVIPPPHKIKGSKDIVEEQQNKHQPENVARRGPLSYEALVHLRKSASMRRTNATEAKTGGQQVSTNKDNEGSILNPKLSHRSWQVGSPSPLLHLWPLNLKLKPIQSPSQPGRSLQP